MSVLYGVGGKTHTDNFKMVAEYQTRSIQTANKKNALSNVSCQLSLRSDLGNPSYNFSQNHKGKMLDGHSYHYSRCYVLLFYCDMFFYTIFTP